MNTCYFEYVLYIMKLLVVVVVDPKQDTTTHQGKKILFLSLFSDQFIPIDSIQSNPIN